MASKDPAFLFYSSDFITGVQVMSMEDRGKYITVLCLMHQQGRLSEETICFLVGSVSVTLKNKFLIDEDGLWYNKRLEKEAEKRKKFAESRARNGSKGGRPKKEEKASGLHMNNHMGNLPEDVNIVSIIKQLEERHGEIIPQQTDLFMYLVVEMIKLFLDSNPDYFFDKESDYSACLEIAYHIASMKKWKKADVVNGKLKDTLASWKTIVDFIHNDDWLKNRSLTDLGTVKEWQRLVSKMNNSKGSSTEGKKMVL